MVDEQLNQIKAVLAETQNAANNETKSSAGDKHETGRAMAQLETEKLTTQLRESLKLKETLSKIDIELINKSIGLGSLVNTNNGLFYLAVGLGKLTINDQVVFVISPLSPIGKLLINKKEKDFFSFNNTDYVIKDVL